MLRRNAKILLATAAVLGVLGAGVAVAADQSTCPYGNTPRAGQTATGTGDQDRLRKRDGTGPRHAQRAQQGAKQQRGQGQGRRLGPRDGSGNPDCPYRS